MIPTMTEPSLIPASRADATRLAHLDEACFRPVDTFSVARFRYLLGSPTCRTLVLWVDGRPLAFVMGLLRHFRKPSGRIYKIAVDRSLARQGWGTRLLQAMEDLFRREGMVASCAEVRISNAGSLMLFEKNGYRGGNRLPAYYPDGEDARKFWKDLPAADSWPPAASAVSCL